MDKKYGFIVTASGTQFVARVIRNRKSGFATIKKKKFEDRASAEEFGAMALARYLESRRAARQRRSEAEAKRREYQVWVASQTLQSLATHIREQGPFQEFARKDIRETALGLWQTAAFEALKEGMDEHTAVSLANREVGRNWTERLAKAQSGDLDRMNGTSQQFTVGDARALAEARNLFRQKSPSQYVN